MTPKRRTLGDLEAAGEIPPEGALKYDVLLGGDWRSLTVEEAKDALTGASPSGEPASLVGDERDRIIAAMTAHVERGERISAQLARKVLAELYGDDPPPAALDAMRTVMGNEEFSPDSATARPGDGAVATTSS